MNTRGCYRCTRCTEELWVQPLFCERCQRAFCVDCILDDGTCLLCRAKRYRVDQGRECVDDLCVWDPEESADRCVCGERIAQCSKHRAHCRECPRAICSFCDERCRDHGLPCHCGSRQYIQCAGKCQRWICGWCSSRTVYMRQFCDNCYCGPCLEPRCPGGGERVWVFCTYDVERCGRLVCSAVWSRCHEHAIACMFWGCPTPGAPDRCVKVRGTNERKHLPACRDHWKRLKGVINTLLHARLPKDVINLIICKLF